MHGANMKIIFITFTLFKTSRHARSKLCPEHCVAQAKADVELCCPALPLNSCWRIQTCGSQKPALLCPAWAALPASQCALGLTVGQLLLYYYHMVQVEHNRTVQQGNICINITEACLNTQCNYMYCTFNLTNFTFYGTCYVTPISLTVLTLYNKLQFSANSMCSVFVFL